MGKFTVKIISDTPILSGVSDSYYDFKFNTFGDFEAEASWEREFSIGEIDLTVEFGGEVTTISPDFEDLKREWDISGSLEGSTLVMVGDFNPMGFSGELVLNISGGEVVPPEPEFKKIGIRNWIGVLKEGDFDPATGFEATTPTGEYFDFNGVTVKYPDGELVEIEGNYINVDINKLTDRVNVIDLYPDDGFKIDRVGLRVAFKNGNGHWVDNPPTAGVYVPEEIVIMDGFFRLTFDPEVAEILVVVDGDGSGGGAGVAGGAFAHNYLLTKAEYDKVSGETFSILKSENGAIVVEKFDQWIDNARLYPFNVDDEDIGTPKKIIAGTYVLETTAKTLRSDVIRLDYGSFEVKGLYDNALDLRGVNCELFLPFVEGSITLKIQDIIDKVLTVVCYVVISDGVMTVNIYSGKDLIGTSTTTIGRSIPLMMVDKATNTSMSINGAINDLRRAFIRVERPIYGGMVLVDDKLVINSYDGFFKLKSGEVVIEQTAEEFKLLQQTLKDGVIKND